MQWQKPCFVQWSNWNKECTSEKAFVLLCAPLYIRSTSLASHKDDTIANSIQLISFDSWNTMILESQWATSNLSICGSVLLLSVIFFAFIAFWECSIRRCPQLTYSILNTRHRYIHIEHSRSLVKKYLQTSGIILPVKWSFSIANPICIHVLVRVHKLSFHSEPEAKNYV